MPTNLRAVPLSTTSLRVSWDGPSVISRPLSDADSTIAPTTTLYYRLYYFDANDAESTENDLTVIERVVDITDLCTYCEYSLRVVAYNANGPSSSSDEISARTLSDG